MQQGRSFVYNGRRKGEPWPLPLEKGFARIYKEIISWAKSNKYVPARRCSLRAQSYGLGKKDAVGDANKFDREASMTFMYPSGPEELRSGVAGVGEVITNHRKRSIVFFP